MSIRKYKKALTDETLQTPPASLKKDVKTSVKSPQSGFDVIVTVERVEGSCPLCLMEGDEKYYAMSLAVDNENVNVILLSARDGGGKIFRLRLRNGFHVPYRLYLSNGLGTTDLLAPTHVDINPLVPMLAPRKSGE